MWQINLIFQCFTVINAQKMKFSIKDLFSKCDHIPVNLVTFTEEILNGTLHFLRSVDYFRVLIDWVLIFEITTTQK